MRKKENLLDQSKKNKKIRQKKYYFRKFVKELKRVRWSKPKDNWIAFSQILLFTIIFTIIIVLFATGITLIWKQIGIETNL
ncbi:MAG: preprotein translocase subunit SecE [Metamycoplasmataceae bacterium]|uniref:preprotein translocase subunit SecE n=1 Tax=Mycoplasmopsis lipophila TaxID=2117 RepID=UPI003873A18D